MCGRFVQVIDIELFVKRFGVNSRPEIHLGSNYNVSPGELAYVITNDRPQELQAFQFGLTPSWAQKKMYLINARSEGDFNATNDIQYNGPLGIVSKPSFRTSIRSRRCLVIASGYIEGPEKERLNKPYLISRKDEELFCFAGIWDTWADNSTGEVSNSFTIITTVANAVTKEIGHHRSPVVLDQKDEQKWLDESLPLEEVLKLLKPYPGEKFKAEAISVKIKDPHNKSKDYIIPIETQGATEFGSIVKEDLKLQGMGSGKRKQEPPPTQGTLF